jgi:hypothetical protein
MSFCPRRRSLPTSRDPCLAQGDADVHSTVHDREFLPFLRLFDIDEPIQHRPTFILSGVDSGVHTMGGELAHSQYLEHLEKSSLVVQATKMEGSVEYFAQGYQDYLQIPLQVRLYNS